MTMNKYLAALILAFGLAVSPAVACEPGTDLAQITQIEQARGAQFIKLAKDQLDAFNEAAGLKPDMAYDYGILELLGGRAVVGFVKDGCVIGQTSVFPAELILAVIGKQS